MYESKKKNNNEIPPFSIDIQHILKNIQEGKDAEDVIIRHRPIDDENLTVNYAEEVGTHQVVVEEEVSSKMETAEEVAEEKPAKKTGWAKKK